MSKFTPAPWFRKGPAIIDSNGVLVASTVTHLTERLHADVFEREANAALIASAPALLEVAKSSRDLLNLLLPIFSALDGGSEIKYAPGIQDIVNTIQLVVDKAEGK